MRPPYLSLGMLSCLAEEFFLSLATKSSLNPVTGVNGHPWAGFSVLSRCCKEKVQKTTKRVKAKKACPCWYKGTQRRDVHTEKNGPDCIKLPLSLLVIIYIHNQLLALEVLLISPSVKL